MRGIRTLREEEKKKKGEAQALEVKRELRHS
jgi:hypothetical protein